MLYNKGYFSYSLLPIQAFSNICADIMFRKYGYYSIPNRPTFVTYYQ